MEVHDEAGQLLVAAHLAIADVMRESSVQTQRQLIEVNRLLDQVSNHLRQLSHELHSGVLEDLGLAPAVKSLADGVSKRTGISVRVENSLQRRLPAAVEIGAYRVIQEALANALKHSRAKYVAVGIRKRNNEVVCSVRDDGVGFNPARVLSKNGGKGLGLAGIRERLDSLGGTVHIHSKPGRGCNIEFRIPLEE